MKNCVDIKKIVYTFRKAKHIVRMPRLKTISFYRLMVIANFGVSEHLLFSGFLILRLKKRNLVKKHSLQENVLNDCYIKVH